MLYIGIEHTASAVFVAFKLVFVVWRIEGFYTVWLVKTYYCIVFTNLQHNYLDSFENLSLEFIVKIILKFRKFQPRYS